MGLLAPHNHDVPIFVHGDAVVLEDKTFGGVSNGHLDHFFTLRAHKGHPRKHHFTILISALERVCVNAVSDTEDVQDFTMPRDDDRELLVVAAVLSTSDTHLDLLLIHRSVELFRTLLFCSHCSSMPGGDSFQESGEEMRE